MFRSILKTALAPPTVAAIFAGLILVAPIWAPPRSGMAAEQLHCLTGDEQRTAIANSKAVPLATVIHTPERLIYMLTLLGRDGKVKRTIVDATNGAVVGER
jgi:hypothetical protein